MTRALVAALLALAAPALAADAVKDAKAVNDAFAAAASIPDVKDAVSQVAALFTDDMQHIGIFGAVKSKEELVKIISQAFAAPGRKVEILSNEGSVLDKETVLTIAKMKNSFMGPDGTEVVLNLRCVRTMKKQKDGKYLIAAEHTSVGVPPPPPPPAAPPAPTKAK